MSKSLKWIPFGHGSGAYIDLGYGFVIDVCYVEDGYRVMINGKSFRKRFSNIDEAKAGGIRFAEYMIVGLRESIKALPASLAYDDLTTMATFIRENLK